MHDSQLLEQFLRDHSEVAFSRIVERYGGIVFGAAFRRLGNASDAEEVTQRVFIDLWRKAAEIKRGVVLTGWLLTATRYASENLLKQRQRREFHEQKAAKMRPESDAAAPGRQWEQLAPYLDKAIESLGKRLRDAVMLRFFEGCSTSDIAQRLGISEEAARQRVSRGVEQMRSALAQRGVVMQVALLQALLAIHASQSPPPGLVHLTVEAATKVGVSKGALLTMAVSKTKIVIGVAAAVALIGGSSLVLRRMVLPSSPHTVVIKPIVHDQWQGNFDRVYKLAPGQAAKLVSGPFIPERQIWWMADQRSSGNPRPESLRGSVGLALETDGSTYHWRSESYLNTLRFALQSAGIGQDELDSSVSASLPLPGDWVFRKGASKAQLTEGIAQVVSAKLGFTVRFEQRRGERDTIVVRGKYHFVPLPGATHPEMIDLIGEKPPRAFPTTISHTTLKQVFADVARTGGWRLVVETFLPGAPVTVAYHPQYGNPDALLQNLAAQTSLTIQHELRDTDLWYMVDASGQVVRSGE